MCSSGEAAQGVREVTAHLEAHGLHAGRLAKVSAVEQHWNMACKVSGRQHLSTVPTSSEN